MILRHCNLTTFKTFCRQPAQKKDGYSNGGNKFVGEVLHDNYQSHNLIGLYCFWVIILVERLSVVYITQPLFTGIGLEFVVRHPGEVDLTVTMFFVKYVLKSLALYAGSNEARASVCLMMKNVLVFNFSCNSNSVDNVPSYSV